MQYQVNDSLRDKLSFLRVGLVFLFGALFVIGLRFVYSSPEKFDLKPVVSKVEEVVEATSAGVVLAPSPTPNEIVYKVRIVNSTGETGLASKTVQKLKDKGIKLDAVLGNGKEKSGTEITFSESIKDRAYLELSLIELFPNAKVVSAKQELDVVVNIGK